MPKQVIGLWHHKTSKGYEAIWMTKTIQDQLPTDTAKTSPLKQDKLLSQMEAEEAKEQLDERRLQRRKETQRNMASSTKMMTWDDLLDRCEIKRNPNKPRWR